MKTEGPPRAGPSKARPCSTLSQQTVHKLLRRPCGTPAALQSKPLCKRLQGASFQLRPPSRYSALKAVLEGSVSAKSRNVAIYATSNRRHLVRETFSDREGDDVHRGETMQEMISLSERFGLHVSCFPRHGT